MIFNTTFDEEASICSTWKQHCWNWLTFHQGDQKRHLQDRPASGGPGSPPAAKTLFKVMEPMLHVDTNAHKDVDSFLDQVYSKIQHSHRLALIFGDEQLVALIWSVITTNPDEYMWVIPFPGEFHLLVHLLHANYRLFANLLLPFANLLS
jgi:hypothetical protein